MRRAYGGPRQTVERRHVIDQRFGGWRMGFQQAGGMRAVQKRQHGDFLAGDHCQRQQYRTRRRTAAGRRRTSQILAQPAHRHHGGRQRNQRERRGAGRDHLRRLMAKTA